MMCEELVELVTAYLDGALDPATLDRVADHLDGCDGCDRYLDQIRRTIAELGHLPPDHLDPEARDRMSAAFRDQRR